MSDECPCWLCVNDQPPKPKPPEDPPQSFEDRVIALAKVLWENRPYTLLDLTDGEVEVYTFSDALDDAVGIILAADGYNIDGECTCD